MRAASTPLTTPEDVALFRREQNDAESFYSRTTISRVMSPSFKPVAILPTFCTLGNTTCGFLAIAKVVDSLLPVATGGAADALFKEKVVAAAWFILLAM